MTVHRKNPRLKPRIAASACVFLASLSSSLVHAAAGQWVNPEQMYKNTCAYCHGTTVAPELLGRQLPAQYIIYTVRHGRNGMPPFRPTDFSKADLDALAFMIEKSKAPEKGGHQ